MSQTGCLFVVRHGESGWNAAGLHQGQSLLAPGLTELGRSHAAAVAKTLADWGSTLVISSDLRRAVETAEPIARALGVPLEIEPRLRERCFGSLEGEPIARSHPDEIGITDDVVTDPDARPAGGESIRQLSDRILGLLDEFFRGPTERRVVLVSHGGPMRVIRGHLGGEDLAAMSWSGVANGAVLEIPLDGSRR